MTITSLGKVLELIIDWEKSLGRYYRHLQKCLENERSKTVAAMLKKQQEEILGILEKIDIKEYENTEFIKNLPDYRTEDIIASLQINRSCPPDEFFEKVLDCEEKLEAYYVEVRSILVYKKSRELFDLLIQFKVGQIRRIKELMGCYDMAV